MPSEEIELAQRVAQGDPMAVGEAFQRYADVLFRVVRPRVPDDESAYDAVSATFEKLLGGTAPYAGRGSLKGWLIRVAVHVATDLHREAARFVHADSGEEDGAMEGQKADMAAIPDSSVSDPLALLAAQDRALALQRAVAQLPAKRAEVLRLRFGLDLDFADIGAAMGIEAATARAHVHFALRDLRLLLAHLSEDSP